MRTAMCVVPYLLGKLARVGPDLIDSSEIAKKCPVKIRANKSVEWAEEFWDFLVVLLPTIKEVARKRMSKVDHSSTWVDISDR